MISLLLGAVIATIFGCAMAMVTFELVTVGYSTDHWPWLTGGISAFLFGLAALLVAEAFRWI